MLNLETVLSMNYYVDLLNMIIEKIFLSQDHVQYIARSSAELTELLPVTIVYVVRSSYVLLCEGLGALRNSSLSWRYVIYSTC